MRRKKDITGGKWNKVSQVGRRRDANARHVSYMEISASRDLPPVRGSQSLHRYYCKLRSAVSPAKVNLGYRSLAIASLLLYH